MVELLERKAEDKMREKVDLYKTIIEKSRKIYQFRVKNNIETKYEDKDIR